MSPAAATAVVVARRVAIALAFVVVLLRPGIGEAEVATQVADVDVIVVLDRTRSMAALDHDGREPRIRGAQDDLRALADALPGARLAMLSFGAEARLTLPFTTDASAFESAVETIELEGPQEGEGSRADRPAAELQEVLERAAEQRPDRRRIVVYVGDGEDTAPAGADQSFDDVADLVSGGVVLGYGTAEGAAMPADDDLDGDRGHVTDPETDGTAISRADLDNLRGIAEELDVPFRHRTGPGGIDAVVESFEASYDDGGRGDARPAEHDLTWVAGLVLLGLVLAELRSGWRSVWGARHTLAAAPSRGGPR